MIYDAVIVGSGASGGWAAKRLAEAGLNVALVEAGRARTDADNREHIPAHALTWRGRTKAPLEKAPPVGGRGTASLHSSTPDGEPS